MGENLDHKVRNTADNIPPARNVPGTEGKVQPLQRHSLGTTNVSKWSAANIGCNDVMGEAQLRLRRQNQHLYVRAAKDAQVADKPYVAQTALFRFKYPHTLRKITKLSRSRPDRRSGIH